MLSVSILLYHVYMLTLKDLELEKITNAYKRDTGDGSFEIVLVTTMGNIVLDQQDYLTYKNRKLLLELIETENTND